jgi:hypothetical protein
VREVSRSEGLDFHAAARNSLGIEHMLTFLFPNSFPSMPPDPNDDVRGKYWEQSSYVGLAITILVPLALFARKERWTLAFFAILAVLGLGLATGENLPFYQLHYRVLPTIRQASRLLPLWSLAAVVLGASGLDWLSRRSGRSSLALRYTCLVGLIVLALAVLPLLPRGHEAPGEAYGRNVAFVAVPLVLLVALSAMGTRPLLRNTILALLVGTVLVDLVVYATGFIDVAGAPAERSDRMRIARLLAGVPTGRVVPLCDQDVHVDDLTALHVPTVDGYNSFFFGNYARFAYLVRQNSHETIGVHAPRVWPLPGSPERMDLLRLMNVTHVVGCMPPPLEGYDMVADRMGRRLYADRTPVDRAVWMCQSETVRSRDEGIERLQMRDQSVLQTVVVEAGDGALPASKPCQSASTVQVLARDRPDGFVQVGVNAAESGILFLSEPYYPERRAWIDGNEVPIVRADVTFSAIPVGPGNHTVELRVVPTSLYVGAIVTAATIVITLLGLVWARGR